MDGDSLHTASLGVRFSVGFQFCERQNIWVFPLLFVGFCVTAAPKLFHFLIVFTCVTSQGFA